MKDLYRYKGMPLHYLSEDEEYAAYRLPGSKARTAQDRYNPFHVYKIGRKFGERGWVMTHQLIDRYADLYSCVCRIRQEQGYSR